MCRTKREPSGGPRQTISATDHVWQPAGNQSAPSRLLTETVLYSPELNEWQRQAITYLKAAGRLSNAEYQRVTGSIREPAARDLQDLIYRGVLQMVGTRGRGTHHVLARKWDISGTNGTPGQRHCEVRTPGYGFRVSARNDMAGCVAGSLSDSPGRPSVEWCRWVT